MVGPMDGKYYCQAKENGYCDRRSGTCFCNHGYKGDSCNECAPSHFLLGSLCYPKKSCPSDCSGAGECNYLTGICKCYEYREGLDCSKKLCTKYHEYCTHCNNVDGCLSCIQGYYVDQTSGSIVNSCKPCTRFDPRCRECNSTACLSCSDLLLTSIRRSGRRKFDPELPQDEKERELSITIPFGSQQTNAFDEAESNYHVVQETRGLKLPLKDHAHSCHEGLDLSMSLSCQPTNISHVICGHSGVFTFSQPTYEVFENEQHIRITVRRSGGGVGNANVSYMVTHNTTDDSDVSPTAFYTTKQTLYFQTHEISKSFLITIHDDRIMVRKSSINNFL